MRYDFLLHASVTEGEDWGISYPPCEAAGNDVDGEREGAARIETRESVREEGKENKLINYRLAIRAMAERRVEVEPRPVVVQASRTEACDLACVYCRPHGSDPGGEMDAGQWREALEFLLPSCIEFLPFCWGEPLMDPHLTATLALASRHRTAVSLITNLNHLTDELAELLVTSVTRMLVSIDTLDESEFQRLRRNASLKRLTRNLECLESAARRLRVAGPWLGLSIIVMRRNVSSIPELVKWAIDRGMRGICARRLIIRESILDFGLPESVDLTSDEYRRTRDECAMVAVDRGIALSMPDYHDRSGEMPLCPCPWMHVYMAPNGALSLCCYSHRTIVGRVPLVDSYWNAPAIASARRRAGVLGTCSECGALDFIGQPRVSQVRGY